MRRAGGYAVLQDSNGKREVDTITCVHCSVVVFVKPGADPGGFCRLCMRALCATCAGAGVCSPFEKKLEAVERGERLMREMRRG